MAQTVHPKTKLTPATHPSNLRIPHIEVRLIGTHLGKHPQIRTIFTPFNNQKKAFRRALCVRHCGARL